MMPKTETSGDDAAEEWSAPVNWKEDPAFKAERRRRRMSAFIQDFIQFTYCFLKKQNYSIRARKLVTRYKMYYNIIFCKIYYCSSLA